MKEVNVFIMRHGEREDEYWKSQGRRLTRHEKLDPLLTRRGYEQASKAWTRLLQALRQDGRQRKIAVFCSPMRRTVGTALMMLMATADARHELFTYAFSQNEHHNDVNDAIPIVILNGLCGCATQVVREGGYEKVIQSGRLPCAVMPVNDGSPGSPFETELAAIQKRAWDMTDPSAMDNNSIQFCRLNADNSTTEPLLSSHTSNNTNTWRVCHDDIRSASVDARYETSDCYMSSLDRAVHVAQEQGCDTVIVIAHRESIASLVHRWGSNSINVSTPYCCIASFVAVPSEHECSWALLEVSDAADISRQHKTESFGKDTNPFIESTGRGYCYVHLAENM
jgi:phosphohistidine phosphatase SixA